MPYNHFMGGWKGKSKVDSLVMKLFSEDGFPATIIRPSYITEPVLFYWQFKIKKV